MSLSLQLFLLLIFSIILVFTIVQGKDIGDSSALVVYFVNYINEPVTLYWHNEEERIDVGTIKPFESAQHNTFPGHHFSYDVPNSGQKRIGYTVEKGKHLHAIQMPQQEKVKVLCTTTKGNLRITVEPTWSPLGAARFLELVHNHYFDGCALNRVVPRFLTQFGISADYEQRTQYRKRTIPDDESSGVPFQPGYMAFAGSGPNSRTTEMFIVMPETPSHQLEFFGTNPWETPFAHVDPTDVEEVVGKWYAYGDMPPWGKGPDPQKIYPRNGYDEYLKTEFSQMDYIESCQILVDAENREEEEEL